MDLTLFKLDIDELLNDFSQNGFTELGDMKRLWLSRKFSFIYEARPTSNLAFFMQGLYSHSISQMVSAGSFSLRLGGLYCLYLLYETQPFKPHFKIYLCVRELRRLRDLVTDAIQNNVIVVPTLVKRMRDKNMFLFGAVDNRDRAIAVRVEEISKLQNVRAKFAYEKLRTCSSLEEYTHMDLEAELGMSQIECMLEDYDKGKELAVDKAGEIVKVEDIKHIIHSNESDLDCMKGIIEDWNYQKKRFTHNTRAYDKNEGETDGFDKELERLLADE